MIPVAVFAVVETLANRFDPAVFSACLRRRAGSVRQELIETHGAWVFLAGNDVWKIKRPVAYSYMDFSTLEKRRRACARELELNRQTAPQIYLGLDRITSEHGGGLGINGPGSVVDWAVHMRRFGQEHLLDKMAERDELPLDLMPQLAEAAHAFHDKAPRHRGTDAVAAMAGLIAGNQDSFDVRPELFRPLAVQGLINRSRSVLDHLGPPLSARQHGGKVRRCHGDLHLHNIVVLDGKPTLFDALEFDENLAIIDILYDLAFLLMDLVHRDLPSHANSVLNHYMARETPGDVAGLALLPLFLSVRAAIRAKVAGDLFAVAADETPRRRASREAHQYFELAARLLDPAPPRLVAIGGLSGTGKSTLGRRVAPDLGGPPGALHLRSDVERKVLSGTALTDRLPDEAYTPEASDRIYARLRDKALAALQAGTSVVVDAVHARPDERRAIEDIADAAGVTFDGLWLEAGRATLVDRVTHRRGDASDADAGVVETQLAYDPGKIGWRRINAGLAPKKVTASARQALEIARGKD